MLLANKRLPYGNQILARIMSLLKSILIREKKIFKYVHVEMALPKKNFKCVQIVLAGAAVNNKEFTHNLLTICHNGDTEGVVESARKNV